MKRLPREGPDPRRRRDAVRGASNRAAGSGFQGTGSGGGEFESSERVPLKPGGDGAGAGGGGGGSGGSASSPDNGSTGHTARGFADPAERSLWGSGEV